MTVTESDRMDFTPSLAPSPQLQSLGRVSAVRQSCSSTAIPSRRVKTLTFLAAFPKGTAKMAGGQVCVSMEPGGYERTSLSVLSVLLTAGYKA